VKQEFTAWLDLVKPQGGIDHVQEARQGFAGGRKPLGQHNAIKKPNPSLEAESIPYPNADDFRSDSVFDPNPHKLDLPGESLETKLLVKSLAVWGPDVLIRAAYTYAKLQVEYQTACRAELVEPRDAALRAVAAYLKSPTGEACEAVSTTAGRCAAIYSVHEDAPDSANAQTIDGGLGAPWFAAEAVSQDYSLEEYDGPGPRESSSIWCTRNAVWPSRAADAAAMWTSHKDVRDAIRDSLRGWATGGFQVDEHGS
jgi:hypothetical protein